MTVLQIKVKPNARASLLEEPGPDGIWHAQLKSPPVGGRANAELITLVAEKFRVPKAAVTIRAGTASRLKLVRIST